ncbi:bifunctional transaldolase/phosoglucose isomerase [Candidatus Acetothermia bacterium]|nr:bifunctional transaldolase/phosoglucose isomerase [Candidatus Acetothermia bacterium]
MTKLQELNKLGQSLWYDNIRRALLDHGELEALIQEGVTGVTSNPTIFEKAIAGSSDYDEALRRLVDEGKSVTEVYESLALEDIGRAADLLRPVYERTGGVDGYVSLEVSPKLANNTNGTIVEAKRLFAKLDRPNVMIKVPATPAGIPAITEIIAEGINVNVTLIFGIEQYKAVAEAYLAGLEKLAAKGSALSRVASVASFFISRIDSAVDAALAQMGVGANGRSPLQGKIAIANAKVANAEAQKIFSGKRWKKLDNQGARVQRLLWASTGTKNPQYSDTLYVDELIGPNTVNTVPPATLTAFRDHGAVSETLTKDVSTANAQLSKLQDFDIDLTAITQKLQDEGVVAFVTSFETLMASITEKRARLLANQRNFTVNLGSYEPAVKTAVKELQTSKVMQRIWAHDYTLWKQDPTEITNRLGWLHSPDVMSNAVNEINAFVDQIRNEGYTHALLLGMGGSSLAPEVYRFTFGVKRGYLDLAVLDSTDPGAVLAYAKKLNPAKTLFIVSTKSGGTVETFSFFRYFYNFVANALGKAKAGEHFIAITDPGSKLAEVAEEHKFRKTFINDPNIGGRYSALSFYGVVPAALIGVDLHTLLSRAHEMACNCESCNCPVGGDNSGARLGAILGELAVAGRDKVTLIASPPLASFGSWLEQLIAESTGKEGTGILPVADEAVLSPEAYGNDRLFAYLRLNGDTTYDAKVQALIDAGHPVVQLYLRDKYDLAGEFFRWEIATVVVGRRLGINPFDQPNVESAKALAREMVAAYHKEGKLPELTPSLQASGISIYADVKANNLSEALKNFLALAKLGNRNGKGRSYVSLQAYVQPTDETTEALQNLRKEIQTQLQLATTLGYGPRFLHSTGQLHKGDAGNGLFIQFTSDATEDAAIPDEAGSAKSSMTFGVLKLAQALGDRQALLNNGRRVIRFHLGKDVIENLKKLAEVLS